MIRTLKWPFILTIKFIFLNLNGRAPAFDKFLQALPMQLTQTRHFRGT